MHKTLKGGIEEAGVAQVAQPELIPLEAHHIVVRDKRLTLITALIPTPRASA